MRQYVVKQGDSPAQIAIAFAGCPKCVADLVAVNPQKQTVRYPNGFVTFQSLHIGERISLPDKWFNGQLDALPKEYFDALPMMPTQSAGVGQFDGIGMGYASHEDATPPTHADAPPNWVHGVGAPPARGRSGGGGRPSAPARGPFQRGIPVQRPVGGAYSQEAVRTVGPCAQWVFGATVAIGQTVAQAFNSNVPPAVVAYAATGAVGAVTIGGRSYFLQAVTPAGQAPIVTSINVYYCARSLAVARPIARPTARGVGASPCPPGTVQRWTGSDYQCIHPMRPAKMGRDVYGVGGPPPPGIPVPGSNVIQPPTGYVFQPQENYTLIVWPIPESNAPSPDPVQVLTDLQFSVLNSTDNGDGSYTVNATYIGTNQLTADPNAGLDTLIITNYKPAAYSVGETIQGESSGVTAVVGAEYDLSGTNDGVLTLSGASNFFQRPETIRGLTSGTLATLKYQYGSVLASVNGMVGFTAATDQGGVSQSLPFDVLAGETFTLSVQPTLDSNGNLADPTAIFAAYGFTTTAAAVQDPSDCSWTLTGINNSGTDIAIDSPMNDFSTGEAMLVKALTVNGSPILAPLTPAQQIGGPTMSACHAFTLLFIPRACPSLVVGAYDPTVGLAALGLTNFTLDPNGPDVLGQYSVEGVWELGDGFQLPTSPDVILTGFTDNGQAQNVATGTCATALPFTIQPGDSVNMIVRPIGSPGQPMTNPVAVLTALGFENVAPASTYSDCTWAMTGDYPVGSPPLQITDPLVSSGVGAVWVVGLSVNGTVVKDANWIQLAAQNPTLTQCNGYTVFFTYDMCPALTGAPGLWDPTTAIATLLPGFKIAPGPNEYGEWSATGTWTGATVDALTDPTGAVTFTFIVNYGPTAGCVVPCAAGTIKDTVTNLCVAPCSNGSAPANGVCPPAPTCAAGTIADSVTGLCVAPCSDGSAPASGVCPPAAPVKGTGPTPVVAPAATSTTGTVVAIGAGVAILGGLTYLALK